MAHDHSVPPPLPFGRVITMGFSVTEQPPWRSGSERVHTTSDMLCEMEAIRARFESLDARLRDQIRNRFARWEAVAFVLNSNRLELVGTQSSAETQELCEAAMNSAVPPPSTVKKAETMQTFRALKLMHDIKEDSLLETQKEEWPASHALLLTPDSIAEVHATLMHGLIERPGEYRTCPAYPHGYGFSYSEPDKIESEMFLWTDALNDVIMARDTEPLSLVDAFKLAALALFHCVDVHPFSDGNGRLCHIIANSMLCQHHFFPVYVQLQAGTATPGAAWRDIYISAIEACRADAARAPADLAALLVESAWLSWQRLDSFMRNEVYDGKPVIGRVSVRNVSREHARERMHARWVTLDHTRRVKDASAQAAEVSLMFDAYQRTPPSATAPTIPVTLPDGCVVLLV